MATEANVPDPCGGSPKPSKKRGRPPAPRACEVSALPREMWCGHCQAGGRKSRRPCIGPDVSLAHASAGASSSHPASPSSPSSPDSHARHQVLHTRSSRSVQAPVHFHDEFEARIRDHRTCPDVAQRRGISHQVKMSALQSEISRLRARIGQIEAALQRLGDKLRRTCSEVQSLRRARIHEQQHQRQQVMMNECDELMCMYACI